MASRQGDIPALESGMSSGLFSGLSSPIGMTRRNFSYDENLDAPHSPPPDVNVNTLWKEPVIPRRRNNRIAEICKLPLIGINFCDQEEERGGITFEAPAAKHPAPVVKAKGTSLMSSLMIKQTHESLERFEHHTAFTDGHYSPHKGLSAEETCFQLPKLRMPSGDFKEDKLTTSAQSTPCGTPAVTPSVTPCVTPHGSPIVTRRNWFNPSPAPFLATPELSSPSPSVEMGGNEGGGGGGGEKWSFFGTRSVVQKSPTDPGSDNSPAFTLQSYLGLQKSTTLEGIKTQANLKVDDPANFMPAKMEISSIEAKRPLPRPHKLKPRDMNVLTPSGF